MKKFLFGFVLLVTALALVACGPRTYEIAMITDSGDIDDRSFNQGTWEGIQDFAEENDKTIKYYKPTAVTLDAYVAAIDLAVKGGAKVVVTPGFLFENSVHKAQSLYPDVTFILIDGSPHNVADWDTMETYDGSAVDFTIGANTLSIFFQEEQSGFLAGYASVMEGFDVLGFMGGMAVPAVVRFGAGYVAGALYAAEEKGLNEATALAIVPANRYTYLNTFAPGDSTVTLATSWFNGGVDIIHAAAGGAGLSVMTAAENTDKWMVGVDVNQGNLNDKVLTSAMKGLAVAVQSALADFFNDEFVGARSITLGADVDAVGLPTTEDSWRFENFTVAEYEAILE
ncbi:MAG: BMP family ABC transporter substrate-binding protein, partial [Tenericutes bacterium HGW-Tenericutes-6]